MPVLSIGRHILEVGAAHPERELFDALMPTPHGTTYNAYLVTGASKTALIDTVDPEKTSQLLKNLEEANVRAIDYLVILHTEQDHSGSTQAILRHFPMARIVAGSKARDLIATHLHIQPDQVMTVGEGDTLDLGGRSLRFVLIPFAHWPDNTMAWLEEEQVLFSNDLFGSHFSTPKAFSTSSAEQRFAAKTYYAEIMMPFRVQIAQYTARVRALKPRLIAPSHGPAWYDPEMILSRYEKWTGPGVKKMVTIPYISMHDSTRQMVEHLATRLSEKGLSVICRDLGSRPDSLTLETGHFLTDLVDAAAFVFGSPTVLGGPHPNVAYAALLAAAVRPKARCWGLIGSFGWGTKIDAVLASWLDKLPAEKLEPILAKGLPLPEDLLRLDRLADDLAAKISTTELLAD
jgi:flavorubredoxin